MNQFPLIPFLSNGEEVAFAFLVFARLAGLFVIAPIFNSTALPRRIRLLLSVMITLIFIIHLHPSYFGRDATLLPKGLEKEDSGGFLNYFLMSAVEMTIGYLIGFCLSLVVESLILAGETIGVLIGFSSAELMDPLTNTTQSLTTQLFTIFGTLLILIFDIHHDFLKLLNESFATLPVGHARFPSELGQILPTATGKFMLYGLKFACLPFVILILVTVSLGFMARIMPEMNIFVVGFPIKIVIGYYALALSLHFFPMLINQNFEELYNLGQLVIRCFTQQTHAN